MSQPAIKYEVEVMEKGRVELNVPFPQGARVLVFVVEVSAADNYDDLALASQSSLDFWDNDFDDEDWNDA